MRTPIRLARAVPSLALAVMLTIAASAAAAWPGESPRLASLPFVSWQDLVRGQISRFLERIWGAPVRIGSVDIGIAPPRMILGKIECSTTLWGWSADVRLARLQVSPVLWSLVRGTIEWEAVEAEGLEVALSGGRPPEVRRGPPPDAAEPMITRLLRVSRSLLSLRSGDLTLRGEFSVDGATLEDGRSLGGEIAVQLLRIEGVRGLDRPAELSGSARWRWSTGELSISSLELRAPFAEIGIKAEVRGKGVELEGRASFQPEAAPWKAPQGLLLRGSWRLGGSLSLGDQGWSSEGTLAGEGAAWNEWSVEGIAGRWKASPDGIEVAIPGLAFQGGTLKGTGRLHPPFDTLSAEVEVAGLPAETAVRFWPGLPAPGGAIEARLQVETSLGGGFQDAHVRGSVRLTPLPRAVWPLEVSTQVDLKPGDLRASGTWKLGELHGTLEAARAHARMSMEMAPVSSVLPWAERAVGKPLPVPAQALRGTISGEAEASLGEEGPAWSARFPVRDLQAGTWILGAAEIAARGDSERWSGEARLEGSDSPAAPSTALRGGGSLSWEMKALHPESWSGRVLADLGIPKPGLRVQISGELRAAGRCWLTATIGLAALGTTADLQVERGGDSSWAIRVLADDGGEGWADFRLVLDESGDLLAALGQMGNWEIRKPTSDAFLSGLLADRLEVAADWVRSAGGALARLRLVEQDPAGGSRPWGAGELRWSDGTLQVEIGRDSPPLRVQASLEPRQSWPFAIETVAPVSEVEVEPAAHLTTTFGGSIEVEGTLRPWNWKADLNLERLALVSAGRVWLATGPVRGTASPSGWRLEPLRMEGEAGQLAVDVDPASGALRVRGDLLAAPLGHWIGEAEVSGSVHADLGWIPGRGASGSLSLEGFQILSGLLPFSLEQVRGTLRLENDHLVVESLDGRSGEGSFRLSGSAPLPGGAAPWNIALEAESVPLRQPPGLSGVGSLALRLEGPAGSPRLAGEVRIPQGVYTVPLSLARSEALSLALDFSDVLPSAARGVAVELDLRADHLWIRSEYTRIECRGQLDLTGTLARPVLRGELTAAEGGEVHFNGVRYSVASGVIEFPGAGGAEPTLELTAETERGDYAVHLEARGKLSSLQVGLRSDPPLPTAEIVRLLTTGRVTPSGEAAGGGLAEGLVGSVVGGRVLAPLESGLQSFLPVDTLDIDPLAVSGQGDPTARITLGKRLSRRVTLSYSSNLGSNQDDLYQLRYRVEPDVELIASREDDGSLGGDVRYFRRIYPLGRRPSVKEDESRLVVRRIRFRGETPFPRRRLRAAVTVAPGERASTYDLFDSRERLWRLHARSGYPQADIQATFRTRRGGTADVVFDIQAGRRLQVRLEGTDLARSLEEELLELWQEPDLRGLAATRAEQRIAEHFRYEGYPSAGVRFAGTRLEGDREIWTFEVHTGRRVKVESLRFHGVPAERDKELLAAIQTRADVPGERGFFVLSRLRADTRVLRDLYASWGYRGARVELDPPELSAGGRQARVSWSIEEGTLHRVGGTTVSPAEAAALLGDPLAELDLLPGAIFNERALARDRETLQARFDALGFPQARVEARVEGEPTALRITFQVDPGPRLVVGTVDVAGNLLTRERVIRRELPFGPGDPLSGRKLAEAQRSLYQLGLFRSVSVERAAAPAPGQAAPAGGETIPAPAPEEAEVVPLEVRVLESPPLTMGATVGYDSVDRLRGRLDLSSRNLFGTRRYAGAVVRAGSTERRVQALLRDPRLFETRLEGLASAFYEEEEKESFDVTRRGARLQVEQKVGSRTRLFYRYSLSDVDLSNVSVTAEEVEPEVRLANLGWALAYDSRDDFVDPHRGLFGSVDLKWYGRAIGSEAPFGKTFLQASYYVPMGHRLVWASGLRAGLARPLRGGDSVPISERFLAGGDTTVRGFARDRLGPIDPVTGDPLGGELTVIVNQEMRFPVWRVLRGVLFYDGGNVFSQPGDFEAAELRHVLGLGIRLNTPLGPLRLDYGRVLDHKEGEDRGALYFSIGQAF